MTSTEIALKDVLESLGYIVVPFIHHYPTDTANTIYTQMPVGRFRLDFALLSVHIGFEADGEYWHNLIKMKIHDKCRDNQLLSKGWHIIRVRSTLLEQYPHVAQQQIKEQINRLIDL